MERKIKVGAILQRGFYKGTENEFRSAMKEMISEDFDTRRDDEDMYRGDFGSSTLKEGASVVYERTSTKKQAEKNSEDFESWLSHHNSKYTIDYAIVRNLGYLAVKVKVQSNMYYNSNNGVSVDRRTYKNITELKKALSTKNPSELKRLYQLPIRDGKNHQIVGRIEGETRLYKTKPEQLPKKYDFIEPYSIYAYGGFCPY